MRKLSYTFLAFLGIYLLLRWDYHVSMFIFNRICSDPTQFGLNIYERVELDEDLLVYINQAPAKFAEDERYHLNGNHMANPVKLDSKFQVIWDYSEVISKIGPVTTLEARINRVSDGKLLSRAVLVRNQLGWLSRLDSLGHQKRTCPGLQATDGSSVSEPVRNRINLIKETFYSPAQNRLTLK